ncbi:cobalt-precorrin-6A reductase [Actinoplanes subtropicus]|uniref:cobalt-precorrin-6A reductase n=1 Tax=Actinoplanes subtropicus TaxID=543632 RepID=UPI0004C3168D|nr:cobalt-precorrin-6A reductase [Actinoplanes subtropicus]
MPPLTVLILGGTTEGRALAAALRTYRVISSLAGRTREPLLPAGEVRIGGFGGVDGLADYLRAERVDILVDATHPFAERISANAAAATAATGVPLLVLRRPGWTERPGDDWRRVPSLEAAAALLPHLGRRVFLTTGRQGLAAFAGTGECWFLARSVEPPAPPLPPHLEVLLDRGPFTVDGELRLLRDHRIDVLVSKDSGGADAKLTAARRQGIPVVLIDRPPRPPAATMVNSVESCISMISQIGGT